MSDAPLFTGTINSQLPALLAAVQEYVKVPHRNRTIAQALQSKGDDLRHAMYRRFRALMPAPMTILSRAKARGWRMGDIGFHARLRARNYMGGSPSIMGTVTDVGGGTLILRSVRLGKRGKRITGGRQGTGGCAARASEARAFALSGEKVMGRRAVETFFEYKMRHAGRGFLSVGWLALRRGKSTRRNPEGWSELVANRVGTPLGLAQFDASGDTMKYRLTSFISGTRKYPQAVSLAMADVTGDIAGYFATKKRQDIADRILSRLRRTGVSIHPA